MSGWLRDAMLAGTIGHQPLSSTSPARMRDAARLLSRQSAEREKRCPGRSHRPPGAAASAGPTNPWGGAHPARWLAGGCK